MLVEDGVRVVERVPGRMRQGAVVHDGGEVVAEVDWRLDVRRFEVSVRPGVTDRWFLRLHGELFDSVREVTGAFRQAEGQRLRDERLNHSRAERDGMGGIPE